MGVVRSGEVLADQGGADDLPVPLQQAAIGLPREDRLRHAGHGERIGKARQDRHQDYHHDRGPDVLSHNLVTPESRRAAVNLVMAQTTPSWPGLTGPSPRVGARPEDMRGNKRPSVRVASDP